MESSNVCDIGNIVRFQIVQIFRWKLHVIGIGDHFGPAESHPQGSLQLLPEPEQLLPLLRGEGVTITSVDAQQIICFAYERIEIGNLLQILNHLFVGHAPQGITGQSLCRFFDQGIALLGLRFLVLAGKDGKPAVVLILLILGDPEKDLQLTGQAFDTRSGLFRLNSAYQGGSHFLHHPLLDLPAAILLVLLFLGGDAGRVHPPHETGYRIQIFFRGTEFLLDLLTHFFRRDIMGKVKFFKTHILSPFLCPVRADSGVSGHPVSMPGTRCFIRFTFSWSGSSRNRRGTYR